MARWKAGRSIVVMGDILAPEPVSAAWYHVVTAGVPCNTVPVSVVVQLLADVPHLIEPIGRMRFAEWGNDDDVDEQISITERESGREDLPVTWVAVDETGAALGAVALGTSDVPGRPELVPCVWGMVVRTDLRRRGIGRLLLQWLEHFAVGRGYAAVWVLTGPSAVAYYERCGWRRMEERADGTLLRKLMPSAPGGVSSRS